MSLDVIYACEYRPLQDEEILHMNPYLGMHANPYSVAPPYRDRQSESGRAISNECRSSFGNTVRKRELEVRSKELLDVGAADIISLSDLNNAEDVDRPETGTMPGSHVLVKAFDCISTGEVAELLVHVVCSRSRVVAEPNTEVLDLQRFCLMYNVDTNDFTTGFLDLLQLPEEIPEPGFRNDFIRSKDAHAVDFRVGFIGSG